MTTRILCVCLGNTCRSPMAQGAIATMAAAAGLTLEVDSAGLGAWHAGKPPDPRGLTTAAKRGYDNAAQRSRLITPTDFDAFDLILAMDASNLARLEEIRPPGAGARIRLFHPSGRDIPDPYYGDLPDYEHALDLIEAAAADLIAKLALPA
ncbi:MAG TPA: low molecular weight protein-tyrosine-phosphatase [Thermohalobaculum sp.]|nr:low molecular weight protein-tyrosine-phosphatase [Thermohalobaculum sp.]